MPYTKKIIIIDILIIKLMVIDMASFDFVTNKSINNRIEINLLCKPKSRIPIVRSYFKLINIRRNETIIKKQDAA